MSVKSFELIDRIIIILHEQSERSECSEVKGIKKVH
jgi:hypothetical protein